jgi:hypothetical protein
VQVLAGIAQGAPCEGERVACASEHGAGALVEPDREALNPPFEPRIAAPDGIEQERGRGTYAFFSRFERQGD